MVDGTFQEYVLSFTEHVTPIPESIDSAQAASIMCAVCTQSRKRMQLRIQTIYAFGQHDHLSPHYDVIQGKPRRGNGNIVPFAILASNVLP